MPRAVGNNWYAGCLELHPTGMHGYMKKKTNEDHNNA